MDALRLSMKDREAYGKGKGGFAAPLGPCRAFTPCKVNAVRGSSRRAVYVCLCLLGVGKRGSTLGPFFGLWARPFVRRCHPLAC